MPKATSGFPRATRGWKGNHVRAVNGRCVSPALRGDGRINGANAAPVSPFPPRYAGMEETKATPMRTLCCFPRATRGWKGMSVADAASAIGFPRATRGWKYRPDPGSAAHYVSPALRGDGRAKPSSRAFPPWFPPRYAGMEGSRSCRGQGVGGFPRATRGWKVHTGCGLAGTPVSPALRGDGREDAQSFVDAEVFPPRYAGMEDYRKTHFM